VIEAGPRVTIVLVTYNALEPTRELIAAIRAFTKEPYELVVVDNASTDGTLEHLRRMDGQAGYTLLANAKNARCAAATNQAISRATTEYVLYLCSSHALVADTGWDECSCGSSTSARR
jgi:glycosyltransferase involved in cell wall biosynthesis